MKPSPSKRLTVDEKIEEMLKERCPWCGEDIRGWMYEEWQDVASDEFEMECPKCDKPVKVRVDTSPTFDAEKGDGEGL